MTDPLRAADRASAPRTLVEVLEETARAHPDAPAVDDTTTVLSYVQLLEAGRSLAAELRAAGVRRADRVGVRSPSGHVDLYVTIVAILYAGAAYVPVDADDPQERADLVFGEPRSPQWSGRADGSGPRVVRDRRTAASRPTNPSAWSPLTTTRG